MGKTKLAPGFRFHPTDVELVRYYLKRKVMGLKFLTNAIAEIDIYNFEPPDLPDKSCQRTGDLEWYFFCPRLKKKKYSSGARAQRSTQSGYWKATAKDRVVKYNDEIVGKIRTLIFHYGKMPHGERTDWAIHEYRLEDKALAQKNVPQDTYVLCKLYKNNGRGSRHGASFKEEDWSDEEEEEDTENLVTSFEHAGPGPSKEASLVATASHSHCPQDWFTGKISESCVSDVPKLTATVLPPLTSDLVAHRHYRVPQVPQAPPGDDDDLDSMLDLFGVDPDESLLLNGFNNQYDMRHEPEVPVVDEAPVCIGDGDLSSIPYISDELFIEILDLLESLTPPGDW